MPSLQSKLLKRLCDDMGSQHTALLLHTEVRWLSRGKIFARLFELRYKVSVYLHGQNFALSHCLTDPLWLKRLAYLADIFTKLNEVNLSHQGKNVTMFTAQCKILSLSRKLQFWTTCVENNDVDYILTVNPHLLKSHRILDENICKEIADHIC